MSSSGERIRPAALFVRGMSESDVPAGLSILEESPEAAQWSRKSLVDAARSGAAWTAEMEGRVAGILIGRSAGDEFEILNLAVASSFRRLGIATKLVAAALERAAVSGAIQTYLEVRASNAAALALYARLGFTVLGRRTNYYSHPAEDAVLFVSQNAFPDKIFHNGPAHK